MTMDEADQQRLRSLDEQISMRERDYQAREAYGDDAPRLQALLRSIAALRREREAIIARSTAP